MKPFVLRSSITLAAAILLFGTLERRQPARAAAAPRETRVWRLVADYQLDARLDPREMNRLELTADGRRLAGHFVEKHASGKENTSTFTGEIIGIPVLHRGPAEHRAATRSPGGGGRLLSLRQDDGSYTVIYAARETDPDHFQGTWYDTTGNRGDFELAPE